MCFFSITPNYSNNKKKSQLSLFAARCTMYLQLPCNCKLTQSPKRNLGKQNIGREKYRWHSTATRSRDISITHASYCVFRQKVDRKMHSDVNSQAVNEPVENVTTWATDLGVCQGFIDQFLKCTETSGQRRETEISQRESWHKYSHRHSVYCQ